jgi:uncharacterized membrane protein YidH (DUF202 family)
VKEALHNRQTAYLVGLCFTAVAVAMGLLTAPGTSDASTPNTLTLVFLIYAFGSLVLWYAYFLQPERVLSMAERQDPRPSMGRMSWLLSAMGVAGMVVPVIMGVILYQMSGQIWRLGLLVGIGLAGGGLLYVRIGDDIRRLADHGFVSWDPFGPSMD